MKFPFKFKHVLHNYEFTAKLNQYDNNNVIVEWTDDCGVVSSTDYTVQNVIKYIDNGTWCAVKYETPINLTNSTLEQTTYDEMFDRIELLEELLAEANAKIVKLEGNLFIREPNEAVSKFKPISEMTLDDWKEAQEDGWKFKLAAGYIVTIREVDTEATSFPVRTSEYYWYTLDGMLAGYEEPDALERIIERVE